MIRIHYHRPGKGTTVFHEHLVLDRPDVKVTLLPTFDGDAIIANGRTILGRGAPVVWYVFPDEWCDVGRFHLADGTFTGWYSNLRQPMQIDGADWRCTDLFLDHWQPVEGPGEWLDETELAGALAAGLLDPAMHTRVLVERRNLEIGIARGSWPPPIAREIDLAQARAAVAR